MLFFGMKILLSSSFRCWWQEPRSCPGGDTFSPEEDHYLLWQDIRVKCWRRDQRTTGYIMKKWRFCSTATLQQPQQIATIYNCYLEKQRNRHFGLWTPWSPLFIFYCQYSLTVLLLPNKEKSELHSISLKKLNNGQ